MNPLFHWDIASDTVALQRPQSFIFVNEELGHSQSELASWCLIKSWWILNKSNIFVFAKCSQKKHFFVNTLNSHRKSWQAAQTKWIINDQIMNQEVQGRKSQTEMSTCFHFLHRRSGSGHHDDTINYGLPDNMCLVVMKKSILHRTPTIHTITCFFMPESALIEWIQIKRQGLGVIIWEISEGVNDVSYYVSISDSL